MPNAFKDIPMKTFVLTAALLSLLTLAACDKPAPPPTVIVQPVPGPPGATGATGMPGSDGSKGEPGKPGEGTTVIVTPPAAPASDPAK